MNQINSYIYEFLHKLTMHVTQAPSLHILSLFFYFFNQMKQLDNIKIKSKEHRKMMDKISDAYQQQRIYFSLIERVGSWNRYQLFLFIIFSAVSILESALIFIPPYLFHQSNYECLQMDSEACTNYVCSLPPAQRVDYLSYSHYWSLADDLKLDFRCEFQYLIPLFSTLVFISSMSGMLIFTTFAQKLGRKQSLILSSSLIFLGIMITLLSGYIQSIFLVVCGITITYWGTQNAYQCIYCFSTEIVGQSSRVTYLTALNSTYSLGIIMNAVTFYFIRQWEIIYGVCFAVPALLIILSAIFFVEKTPLDLLANEKEEEIVLSLNRIAKFNKIQAKITIEQIIELKNKYLTVLDSAQQKSFTVIDLFQYKSLRPLIIPLLPLNFLIIYLFYAPSVINNSQGPNQFKNSIIEGMSNILSVYLAYLALNNMKRRTIGFIIITSVLVVQFLLLSLNQDKTSSLYDIYYFIFRLLVSTLFSSIYLTNYQTFPTQIRVVGATFSSMFGSLAGIIQPHVVSLWANSHLNIMYSFIIITVVAFLPNYFMKQTYQVPPSQIIEELDQTQGKNSKRIQQHE